MCMLGGVQKIHVINNVSIYFITHIFCPDRSHAIPILLSPILLLLSHELLRHCHRLRSHRKTTELLLLWSSLLIIELLLLLLVSIVAIEILLSLLIAIALLRVAIVSIVVAVVVVATASLLLTGLASVLSVDDVTADFSCGAGHDGLVHLCH